MTPLQLVNNLLEDDPLEVPLSDLFHVPKKGLVLKLKEGKYWSLYHDTYDIRFGEIYKEHGRWISHIYLGGGWIPLDQCSFKTFDEALYFLVNNKDLIKTLEVINSLNIPEWLKITHKNGHLIFFIRFNNETVLEYYSKANTVKDFVESPKLREIYEVISDYLKNPDSDVTIHNLINDIIMGNKYYSIHIFTDIVDNSNWTVDDYYHNYVSFNTFYEAFNYALEQVKQRST